MSGPRGKGEKIRPLKEGLVCTRYRLQQGSSKAQQKIHIENIVFHENSLVGRGSFICLLALIATLYSLTFWVLVDNIQTQFVDHDED